MNSFLLLRRLALVSNLLLIAVSLSGLTEQPIWFAFGYLITYLANRYVHPICPACATCLHGFGWPMLLTFGIHSLADGFALSWGTLVHKLPEAAAMYLLFRSAFSTQTKAIAATAGIQLLTPLALWLPAMPEELEPIAKGSMLFLGLLALHPLRPRNKVLPVRPIGMPTVMLPPGELPIKQPHIHPRHH